MKAIEEDLILYNFKVNRFFNSLSWVNGAQASLQGSVYSEFVLEKIQLLNQEIANPLNQPSVPQEELQKLEIAFQEIEKIKSEGGTDQELLAAYEEIEIACNALKEKWEKIVAEKLKAKREELKKEREEIIQRYEIVNKQLSDLEGNLRSHKNDLGQEFVASVIEEINDLKKGCGIVIPPKEKNKSDAGNTASNKWSNINSQLEAAKANDGLKVSDIQGYKSHLSSELSNKLNKLPGELVSKINFISKNKQIVQQMIAEREKIEAAQQIVVNDASTDNAQLSPAQEVLIVSERSEADSLLSDTTKTILAGVGAAVLFVAVGAALVYTFPVILTTLGIGAIVGIIGGGALVAGGTAATITSSSTDTALAEAQSKPVAKGRSSPTTSQLLQDQQVRAVDGVAQQSIKSTSDKSGRRGCSFWSTITNVFGGNSKPEHRLQNKL